MRRDDLFEALELRFHANSHRHETMRWSAVQHALAGASPEKIEALAWMDASGGEPDVVDLDAGSITFVDCSLQSPAERRSLCYDARALAARKKNKPRDSATAMAENYGLRLLTEQRYRDLQRFGPFDSTTSSWLLTPAPIRELGGAIFGDYRYGTVFVSHNGADSYYSARGFRCSLTI